MEIDSQNLTPPGSPILGYSGIRDSKVSSNTPRKLCQESESESNVSFFTFSCKGPVYSQDKTFSPHGFFRRNEINTVLQIFNSLGNDFFEEAKTIYKFFGFDFHVTEIKEMKILIQMCRNRIYSIENLAWRTITFKFSIPIASRSIDDGRYQNPLQLRQEISSFLNFLVKNLNGYMKFDYQNLLAGLIRSLGTTKQWSSSLLHHCGSKTDNQCTSPEYHLFHLNWEIRWFLLIIFRMKDSMLNWILDDLFHIAYMKFRTTDGNLAEKSPFNCYCIKEFWAMLRILIEEIKPNGNCFWDVVTLGISRLELNQTDLLFPLWMMSHLAELWDYDITGEQCSSESSQFITKTNCYEFINNILKDWLSTNTNIQKVIDVHSFLQKFITCWGFDLTLIVTLWSHWFQRIDKGFEVRNLDPYSSATKWLRFVTIICEKRRRRDDTIGDPLSTDSFFAFVSLLIQSASVASMKDWRKLTSSICSRMSQKTVESLSENGLTRMVTIFLCMATIAKNDSLDMCERLDETLHYAKESLRLTKVRGRCAMVLLLLQKSIDISSVYGHLMRTVDEVMGTIHRSPAERDQIMVYLDLIENLPKVSPDLNLGQSNLISINLTPWLASCGPNYVTRTLRILHILFHTWLLAPETIPTTEKSRVAKILQEKTEQFLQQTVIGSLDCSDVTPFAEFAVDLTLFQKSNRNISAANKFFQLFALTPRTVPKVSEIYIDRLISNQLDSSDNFFLSEIPLTQCWIRLIILGCEVPLKLSQKILNPHTESENLNIISTTLKNDVLLKRFCEFVNSSECFWTKSQLGEILNPVGAAVKVTVEKGYDRDLMLVDSVVNSTNLILKTIIFDKIYIRNSQSSFVHLILESFVPSFLGKPPWEKMSIGLVKTLKNFLHQIFISIIKTANWLQDPFLKRKLCDIFRFAFLGYITTGELEEDNPGLLIMRHIETINPQPEPLLNEIISNLQQLNKEEMFVKRFLLATVGFQRRRMLLTSVWLFGPLLDVMLEKDTEIGSKCSGILINCISLVLNLCETQSLITSNLKLRLLSSFETSMTKHFAFRSKRFFEFFNSMGNYGSKKPIVRDFVYKEILPILTKYVHMSEMKQGAGSNYAMRTQLKILETNLAKTMELK